MKELPKVYFERLLESSPDIVVAVDKDGTIIFYNDGATRTLGYDAEEVLGTHVDQLYPTTDEPRKIMAALRSEDPDGVGRVHNFPCQLKNKAGEIVPAAMSGSIIFDARGREHGSIGFAKDISELMRHEQIETLGELAISLAHEINSPLETLVNHAAMLERFLKKNASGEQYETEHNRIVTMKRELRRIQSIVERLGEMAASGIYGTTEYLPGRLMADLGLEHEEQTEQGSAEAGKEGDGNDPDAGSRLKGMTVLICDDDKAVRVSVADVLQAEGCTTITTESGSEALEKISNGHTVDLVLSDVVMPDIDGYEVFKTLQTNQPDLPVVLMTGYYYDKDHVLKRSRSEGLQDVIYKKPIKPKDLVELVRSRVGD